MPTIDLHDNKEFDAATKTKLDIFESYLTEWLPTFLFSNPKVNICDFFAGPGTDILGNIGSPLRILNVVKQFESLIVNQNVQINLIFNEYKLRKYTLLKENVERQLSLFSGELKRLINIAIYNDDFKQLFQKLSPQLLDGPNLFFFDQNGVKQITIKFIQELENYNRTDYLFFLSSGYFKRFEFKHIFPDLNIEKKKIQSNEIHRIIVEKIREALPEHSKTRLYHFSLKKKGNIYGLVFGSMHLLAVEKYLKVAWSKNTINGAANFDIDSETQQQMDLFFPNPPKTTKLKKFESNLTAFAKKKKIFTNKEVLLYTLEEGFTPKHAREVLIKLRKSKALKHFSHAKIGYKQAFKDNDTIDFEYIK